MNMNTNTDIIQIPNSDIITKLTYYSTNYFSQ